MRRLSSFALRKGLRDGDWSSKIGRRMRSFDVAARLARLACALALAVTPSIARAGGSAPILSMSGATAFAGASGARVLTANGSFNFDDLVQLSFPAGLIVWQGTHFVRYDVSGAVVEGDAALLAGGIDATQIPTLLGLGAPASAATRLVQLGVNRITVALPAAFSSGGASAMLYAAFDGGSFASNAVAVSLP